MQVDGDEELRRIHKDLGPRQRYNDPRYSKDCPDHMMIPTEKNAIKAANASITIYDSATKLAALIGNEELATMHKSVLVDALGQCAEALGYRLTPAT